MNTKNPLVLTPMPDEGAAEDMVCTCAACAGGADKDCSFLQATNAVAQIAINPNVVNKIVTFLLM
ncbi:MAG: hypothetical protein QM642_00415 [Edaphocola sp.]